jgi:hypothetical protein
MSSISSVSSSTSPNVTQPANRNPFAQIGSDFLAIGSALQSGTLTDAQNALATFQQSVSNNLQNTATQLFSGNSQASTAYQNLVNALNSGDSSGAQQAYSNLLATLKNSSSTQATSSAHHGHHHHHHGEGSSTSSASASSTSSTGTSQGTASSFVGGTNSGSATDRDGDNDESSLNAMA